MMADIEGGAQLMKKSADGSLPVQLPKDPFAYIGFWQLMTFIMLILLVWLNELRDMSAVFFSVEPQRFNIFRGFLLTAAVLVVAIITIGNTYLQQKRVLNTLISVCAKCNKVRVNGKEWQKMEDYVSENSLLTFSHGLCPDCMEQALDSIQQRKQAKLQEG